MDGVTRVSRDALPEPTGTSDVERQVIFDTHDTLVIRSRVGGDVTTGWHHNGDRHVYGYVTAGRARLEYGPAGAESIPLTRGDFVYVPPRTIRRVVNPTNDDWIVVLAFVGAGPPAISVNGPERAEE